LKISPLLAQFLFTNKQLSLASLGRFILDDSGGIVFQQDPYVKEDAELVSFIAESTGKMKSLVSADLESNLELARQFLHIGKPYLFEGIGTLSKNKSGNYDFVQSQGLNEKNREGASESRDMTSTTENSFTDYEEMFSPKKPKGPATKKILTWFVAIAGLSLAIFGGYFVYNRTKNKKDAIVKEQQPIIQPQKDSLPRTSDTLQTVTKPVDSSGTYRFVIEKALKQRALKRYAFLKSIYVDVKMETKDSVLFKLFFVLPATPADTARIRDSLQVRYGTRSKTVVEPN
jgi:hypothetical protein